MAQNNATSIFQKFKQDRSIEHQSKTWFQQQTILLSKKRINEKKLFSEQQTTSKIRPGKLYLFYYDPKHKATLQHYDRFPLVFPFKSLENGFLGLNMHYLPYFLRVQLMTRLLQYANNKNLDDNTKLNYSWSLINGVAKFKSAEPCVKHYLKDHVQSLFIDIPASDWHTAMMLPVERFVGSNKSNVWVNSWQQIS